ncbi:hypothetical protein [Spiroplasma phoeniceum]|uniref:Uncharacterized protein n=1 Tax=Spiroplasma phoeniceum P40 TaxID=1276259 RepID=A0A345DSS6_9MOLU|nr:hypothetical protein [Spiroplasma phoeniceum]AXF97267.1 hypothetical protein SDAV_003074 [Spiroplasma phoeniceum P40]
MWKKKNTVDGNKVGQNDNIKIGNNDVKNNSKIKQKIKDSTINNYNFIEEKIRTILNSKEKNEGEKLYNFIEMINELKFYNYELEQKVCRLEKLNEMKNNVYKKYVEFKKKYETLKENCEKEYEEVYIKLDGENVNIIFELKKYLKSILKNNYDKLVHNIKITRIDDNRKSIILINKNKGYGGQNDIDILIHNWLEIKASEEKEYENVELWN